MYRAIQPAERQQICRGARTGQLYCTAELIVLLSLCIRWAVGCLHELACAATGSRSMRMQLAGLLAASISPLACLLCPPLMPHPVALHLTPLHFPLSASQLLSACRDESPTRRSERGARSTGWHEGRRSAACVPARQATALLIDECGWIRRRCQSERQAGSSSDRAVPVQPWSVA